MVDNTAAGFFHPSRPAYRYTILFFIALLTFGSYFAYDSIGAIENVLIESLHLQPGTIGSLYSAYSLAAIAIVFLGGILTDRLGVRRATLLFSGLVCLGAVVVAVAAKSWVLFAGRLIFGAGSESLVVAQMAFMTRWFKGKELALAFGISLTISRLGTLFSFNTEAMIANYFGHYRYALWAAVILCLVSLAGNFLANLMDARGERVLKNLGAAGSDKIVLADIRAFKPSYWYVTLLCLTFYSAIFPFTALSTHFFATKWNIPDIIAASGGFLSQVFSSFTHMFSTAPGITSIVIFASMVFAPFAGRLVDKAGKRASLMIIGSLILIPSHLIMGLTRLYPAWPMIALGAAFVLVPAAMWPTIPLIVAKDKVGTAFGLTTMIQNIGLALFPFLNGKLHELTGGYAASSIMFAGLGLAGLVFAFLLKRADAREGGALQRAHRAVE